MRSLLVSRGADRGPVELTDRRRALPGEPGPARLDAGKWRAALPEDAWPRHFPVAGFVWRQDVFDVAVNWRRGRASARQLLAATLMWRADGALPATRRRAVRMLADDPRGWRLEAALEPLRAGQPGTADLRWAYLAFRTGCRLPAFDSDAATALLYFAGYRRGRPTVQPLILDAAIAARIPTVAGVSNPANRGSSLEWTRWIAWAAAQAGEDVEPELVEMDLAAGGCRYGATEVRVGLIPRQRRRGGGTSLRNGS